MEQSCTAVSRKVAAFLNTSAAVSKSCAILTSLCTRDQWSKVVHQFQKVVPQFKKVLLKFKQLLPQFQNNHAVETFFGSVNKGKQVIEDTPDKEREDN